jgi:hypothetical protein
MSADQLTKWKDYGGLGQGFFFLLSWTLTPSSLATVAQLAAEANGNLPNFLYDQIVTQKASKPNIVYIDYVDSIRNKSVILYNFD